MIGRVKGTQDLLDCKEFNDLSGKIRTYMGINNFSEIQTPILEHARLFTQTLGEATDVVSKEMFIIKSHSEDDKESICLRPEATAATMRAFLNSEFTQNIPWKVFTIGAMFRYERPQKGRLRQFHGWNLEIIGTPTIAADAELILLLDRFFHEILKMENYTVQINFLGCKDDRKNHHQKLYSFIANINQTLLCKKCIQRKDQNLLRIFDCKEEACQTLYKDAPKTTDNLCAPCNHDWIFLQDTLQLLSISSTHNPLLVRGLDYYTKTVFEFVAHTGVGAQSTFCGGGRYDGLANILESKESYPSLGAGIGIERLLLALETQKQSLTNQHGKKYLITILPYDSKQFVLALLTADMLRNNQIPTEILFDGSVKSRMRKIDKNQSQYLFFIGPEEQNNQTVTIKNMETGEQEIIKLTESASYIKNKKEVKE